MLTDITYDLPFGPQNLKSLFPQLNWDVMQDYYVELEDSNGDVIVTTPLAVVSKSSSASGVLVLHFLNYLGRFDAIVFNNHSRSDEVKSETWTKALPVNTSKKDYGSVRRNIQARDGYAATTIAYSEKQMKWIEQLLESPLCYLQWKGTEGQADDYIPVVVGDRTMEMKKLDDRYVYEFTIEFKSSNEKISLRT